MRLVKMNNCPICDRTPVREFDLVPPCDDFQNFSIKISCPDCGVTRGYEMNTFRFMEEYVSKLNRSVENWNSMTKEEIMEEKRKRVEFLMAALGKSEY